MNKRRIECIFLFLFLSGLFVVRLFAASHLELSADEAYYFQWSKTLSFCYPDHPPMVAWLIRLGTTIAGETPVGVRLMSIVLGFGGGWITYLICLELRLSHSQSVLCAALENILLMPAVGALLVTPDVPLAFNWLLAILLLTKLYKRPSAQYIYMLVIPLGAACYSKHNGILLLFVIGLTCLSSQALRNYSKKVHLWVALLVYIALLLPWLLAEYQLGFPSIIHQSAHAYGALPGNDVPIYLFPIRWIELLLGQFSLLSPLVFIWCIRFLWTTPYRNSSYIPSVLGLLIPIGTTMLVAIFTHPEQNWASIGHPAAAIIAVVSVSRRPPNNKKYFWALGTVGALTTIVHLHAISPFLPLPPQRDPVMRLHGWKQLAMLSKQLPSVDAVVCDNYGVAAHLSWQLRDKSVHIPIVGINRSFQSPPPGYWLILDEIDDYGDYKLNVQCGTLTPLLPIPIYRNSELLRTIKVYRGFNCHVPEMQ